MSNEKINDGEGSNLIDEICDYILTHDLDATDIESFLKANKEVTGHSAKFIKVVDNTGFHQRFKMSDILRIFRTIDNKKNEHFLPETP